MRTYPRIAAVVSVVAVVAFAVPAAAVAQSEATSPTSPVNLATPVDFGAAKAAPGATVLAGDARFEVLGDGLIRMEYSPTGSFEDAPTVNAVNRRFEVPRYRSSQSHGWLTITTSEATLRYRLGSGPFGPDNTSVRLAGGDTVSPEWENVCPFDQVCDAGAAALSGGANIQTDHAGYLERARRARRSGGGHLALRQLHRRARRPRIAHDRPDRERYRRQDPDAAADEQLGRLEHRHHDGAAECRHQRGGCRVRRGR
jgi:hypothetical protein